MEPKRSKFRPSYSCLTSGRGIVPRERARTFLRSCACRFLVPGLPAPANASSCLPFAPTFLRYRPCTSRGCVQTGANSPVFFLKLEASSLKSAFQARSTAESLGANLPAFPLRGFETRAKLPPESAIGLRRGQYIRFETKEKRELGAHFFFPIPAYFT